MKVSLARKTKLFRHKLVQLIAPTVYATSDPVRPMIRFLERQGRKQLVGVEIGVEHGINALNILKTLPIKTLYLVDPYEFYFDVAEGKHKHAEIYFEMAKANLSQYNARIEFIRKKSVDAVNDIPTVDFIYVDGDHSYENVKCDIQLYHPKVRFKGVLGGHDYPYFPGVFKAVNEFVETNKLKLHHKIADWWIVKQKNEHPIS